LLKVISYDKLHQRFFIQNTKGRKSMINQETIQTFCEQLGAVNEKDEILKSLINNRNISDIILYERAGNLTNEDAEYFIMGMHLNISQARKRGLRAAATQKIIREVNKAKTVSQLVEHYIEQGKLAERYFIKRRVKK
jgi:hypothetical protein